MISPNILTVAAETIKREAERTRAYLALADELVKIGSIENAAQETQARLDKLKAEEAVLADSLRRRRADADAEAEGIKRSAESEAAVIRDQAQRVMDDAKERAAVLIEGGKQDAMKYLADAKDAAAEHENRLAAAQSALKGVEAQHAAAASDIEAGKRDRAMVADYQKRVSDAKAELETLERRKSAATGEINRLTAAFAEKQAAHDRIEAAIDAATAFRRK